MMQSCLPNIGLGTLKTKEIPSGPAPNDKVSPSLLPQGDFYKELAKKCANYSVSVSIVATPSSSIDMATLCTIFPVIHGLNWFR